MAEALGAALVFLAVGVATLTFGFKMTGGSTSAGVLATALAFGLVLLALAYTLGPASGCHINPAVTRGILRSGRMAIGEALGYLGHSVGEPAEKEPARGDGPAPYCGEEVLL